MDGFTRRKEQSKEEIRKAAWELFSRHGVDKVSMMDIAHKAGVSQVTIYNNFGSKEALAREFVSFMVDVLESRVQEIVAMEGSYQDKMAAFFQFISALLADGRPSASGGAVFAGNAELHNDPEIKEIRIKAQERMIALLLQLIKEGKKQGQVNEQLSEDALRYYFVAFMEIFPNAEFQRQYARRPNLVDELGELMMYGLKGDEI
jgi:AcrR family transcriptional regulator